MSSRRTPFGTAYQVLDSKGRIWAQSSNPEEIRRSGQELEAQAQPYADEGADGLIEYGDHHGPVTYQRMDSFLVTDGWQPWVMGWAPKAVTPDEQ